MKADTHILGIETSGKVGGVALGRGGEVIDEISFEKGLIHGRTLVPTIKELLERCSLGPNAVNAVAVSAGPGSFTGVRVGVACAKMFAYSTGAKLLGVATPDVIVRNAPGEYQYAVTTGDARRGNVFACIYRRAGEGWRRETDLLAVTPEQLLEQTPRGALVLGDAIPRFAGMFQDAGLVLADESLWYGRASVVVKLSWDRFRRGLFEDVASFVPTYLRPTEAEVNLMQKRMQEKRGGSDANGGK